MHLDLDLMSRDRLAFENLVQKVKVRKKVKCGRRFSHFLSALAFGFRISIGVLVEARD